MKSYEQLRQEKSKNKQYIKSQIDDPFELVFLLFIAEGLVLTRFIVTPVAYAWNYFVNATLEEVVSEINYRKLYRERD